MAPIIRSSSLVAAVIATAVLLATASTASAVYVHTPLRLSAPGDHADVGDAVEFTLEPNDDTNVTEWAGRTLRVVYSYDANEGADGSEPDASTDSSGMREGVVLESLALDDAARATFTWTIPADVQDKNVNIAVVNEDGDGAAFAYLAIGDAPPVMRTTSSPDDGREIDNGDGDGEPLPPASDDEARQSGAADDSSRTVPGLAVGGALVAAGAVAVALARRR